MNRLRQQNLDFLRIYFTLVVVFGHLYTFNFGLGIPFFGPVAVEFFFILSGYCLAKNYNPKMSVSTFLKKKLIRFLPLIILGELLCGSIKTIPFAMFFIEDTGFAGNLFDVCKNAPVWYLSVLFWVSAFYFLLLKCFPNKDKRLLLIGTIVFISLIIIGKIPGDRHQAFLGIFQRGLLRGVACIGLGTILGLSIPPPHTQGIST